MYDVKYEKYVSHIFQQVVKLFVFAMDIHELEESFLGDENEEYSLFNRYDTDDGYTSHERPQFMHDHQNGVASVMKTNTKVSKSKISHCNPTVVDLSLASSYLPGIYAMLKVLVLLSALNIMQKLGMHMDQAIIVCASCLYIDRCTSVWYILDTGACALCVLISVCVNASRISIGGEPGLVNMSLSLCWILVSTLVLCDVHRSFAKNVQIHGMINVITSSFCAVHGFLCLDSEVDAIAYMRAVVFTILTVLWIYTLNLRDRRDLSHESFSGCVDRFAVVLVADIYVCGSYAVMACIIIAWRHHTPNLCEHPQAPEIVCEQPTMVWPAERRDSPASSWTAERRVVSTAAPVSENDPMEMDVQTAFRLAQANSKKGVHAR